MDREGFRNRLKQYKEAKGFDPLLTYWEWKQKYDSAPQPDSMPSQPQPDLPTVAPQPLDDRAHRWDNKHYVDPVNTVFDADRHRSWKEPALKTFGKGRVKFTYRDFMKQADVKHMKFLQSLGRLGNTLKGASIFGEVVQNLFPSEEAELIEDLRVKMDKQNKWLTGQEDIPKYAGGGEVGTPSVGMADFNTKLVNLLGETSTKGLINTIKRRLYDNLVPYNYGNDMQGVTGRIINSVWKNKQEALPSDEYNYDIMRDDIFAEYLGIPSNRRHDLTDIMGNDANDKKHLVIPSEYKPAKQTDSNVEYKTINKIKDQDILKATNFNYDADGFPINPLEFNENRTVHAGGLETYFGSYTVSRGVDPVKGEYRSFYDLWDLNPFYGKYSSNPDNTVEKILNKISGNKDTSLGIGKPIEFYDRVYLDDYYNVNSAPNKGDYYGGYLPEIIVTNKR